MPKPDWDAPHENLAQAAREAGITPDWSCPEFMGFVEEWKFNRAEYLEQWRGSNADRERERQLSGEHMTARQVQQEQCDQLKRDMAQEAGREMRGQFYRDVSAALDRHPGPTRPDAPHGFTGREKAEVLRHMADQIEKAQNPVERAQDRVAERDAFRGQFFQQEPAKPTPSMVERWTQRAEQERAAMRERGGRGQQQEQEQERER